MTSPRRHGLPRKKPDAKKQQEIEADLPVLEPLAGGELPVLEPLAPAPEPESPVQATCAPATENGFDVVLTVDVPAMDKKDVPDAVRGPLQRLVDREAALLRWRRVLVRFTGEAMVGSAIKELVGGMLKLKKPGKVTVRRGFGDELVHESTPPKVAVDLQAEGATIRAVFATGELEAADLPVLLKGEFERLAAGARGKRIALLFQGAAKPDATLREQLGKALREVGAVRVAIGERVLFDRELEDRVQVKSDGAAVVVQVAPAADAALTQEALQMVLAGAAASFAGKVVRVHFTAAAGAAELDRCVELCRHGAPQRIEVGDGKGEADVVWPKLIEVAHGNELIVRLQAGGRSRAGVLRAFRREGAEHQAALRGKPVVVDWPAGWAFDAETEQALGEVIGTAAPKTLACTIGGEHREPFVPAPVTFAGDGDLRTVRLDTDAGKPLELARAVERRLPAVVPGLRGKQVRLQIVGAAAPSRTLLRTLCAGLEVAGPARLEVEDHGVRDVLVPAMLKVQRGGGAVRVVAAAAGRDATQQKLALQRELDAAELGKGADVVVAGGPEAEAVVAALVARGAQRVAVERAGETVQVHPEPAPKPAAPPAAPPVAGSPVGAAPAAAASGSPISILAQKDDAVPPLLVLGVEAGDDAAHVAAIERQLQQHAARFTRRCVMLVLQKAGQDVPVRRPEPLVTMLGRVVSATAAATLVFRGPDAQQRPHFQVLHSTLRALPVGATFGDPRRPR